MEFLKEIYNIIRGGYYFMYIIFGWVGFEQIINCEEPNETNIIVTIVSIFAIEYGIKNIIKIVKEIWNKK